MSLLQDRRRDGWVHVLDEYEAHLARQEAHLARLSARPGTDGDLPPTIEPPKAADADPATLPADTDAMAAVEAPDIDELPADPGPFVPPEGLPPPPEWALARLIELRERTALLSARSESVMRTLRPDRRSRLHTPESATASVLDRQM